MSFMWSGAIKSATLIIVMVSIILYFARYQIFNRHLNVGIKITVEAKFLAVCVYNYEKPRRKLWTM
jgi:phosphatidylserine synthase